MTIEILKGLLVYIRKTVYFKSSIELIRVELEPYFLPVRPYVLPEPFIFMDRKLYSSGP